MAAHLYIKLEVPRSLHWSAMALVAGESTGPCIRLEQCECGTLRIEAEDGHVRYAKGGNLSPVEPPCI